MMKRKKDDNVIVRMATPLSEDLFKIIFSRYPDREWGSFVRFGFHPTEKGLVLTLVGVDTPCSGELNPDVWITEIQGAYSSRILRQTETHNYAVGFVHSHPLEFETGPSESDYQMESYYANLLKAYTPARPFVSLVFALSNEGQLAATGRVYWNDKWSEVDRFSIESRPVTIQNYERNLLLSEEEIKRMQRLVSQFSLEAAENLARATVGVVGASGTGSPCIEMLARAGVGQLIIIDPDGFEASNLERIHGSSFEDISNKTPKVLIAGRHVKSINPTCAVQLLKGKVPQAEVVNALLKCDLVLGCTDLHSSRVALSDISLRYLVPVIDVGVIMEGAGGSLTGQVVQINRLFPNDPCVYCRTMIDSKIAQQELLSPEERERLIGEAQRAEEKGDNPGLYWLDSAQLNTVGYLTTLAGSLVVAYGIGYLTGRFAMISNRLEINLSPHGIQIVERNENFDAECRCRKNIGSADQDVRAIMSAAPAHWQKVEKM